MDVVFNKLFDFIKRNAKKSKSLFKLLGSVKLDTVNDDYFLHQLDSLITLCDNGVVSDGDVNELEYLIELLKGEITEVLNLKELDVSDYDENSDYVRLKDDKLQDIALKVESLLDEMDDPLLVFWMQLAGAIRSCKMDNDGELVVEGDIDSVTNVVRLYV